MPTLTHYDAYVIGTPVNGTLQVDVTSLTPKEGSTCSTAAATGQLADQLGTVSMDLTGD